MRKFVAVIIAIFIASCTKDVARPPVEARHFTLEMEALEPQRVEWRHWLIEGVPLTPAQWPLEASLKKLLELDFAGVIDNFDLRFHSSHLEGNVLEDLFDAGYLPVYVRVENRGDTPDHFFPDAIRLAADEDILFFPVSPQDLPRRFREIDWVRTSVTVVLSALILVLIVVAAKDGRDSSAALRMTGRAADASLQGSIQVGGGASSIAAAPAGQAEPGILGETPLAPGGRAEGFMFFRIDRGVADWTSVRIVAP